ncbi:MAG: histidine phosphatase family protein [Promicromonosporaceae bacterium]|nr:histidine phosphatase family protein [Promicromonosporaceae bacterium]
MVLWRHGRTAWNATGRLQGQADIPLDDFGRQQVGPAATALATAFPGAPIIASDLTRAWESAQVLGRASGITPIVEPRLRERSFGKWEGLARDEIASQWPELFSAWQHGSDTITRPPEGESRGEVGRRVAEAIREHAALVPSDEILLVVSHGAAITAAITALIGEDPDTWRGITGLDNANWSVLVPASHDDNGWRLTGHNLGATPLRLVDIFGA